MWAVGSFSVAAGTTVQGRTLVEHWDGTRWSIVTSPSPGTVGSGPLRHAASFLGPLGSSWSTGELGTWNRSRKLSLLIMEPERGPLSPELRRWSEEAPREERRTVTVRLAFGTDPVEAANQLAALGIAIDTTGAASVVGSATPDVLRRASEQPWVLAVEEPRRLFPR